MFLKFVIGGAIIGAIASIFFGTDIRVGIVGCAIVYGILKIQKYAA